MAADVIGRRAFDMTNGWDGKPAGTGGLRLWPSVLRHGGLAEPLRLENPSTIVRGDRVTHLVYDVHR